MSQKTDEGDDNKPKIDDPFSDHKKAEDVVYTPIKALSTFNYDWRIKVRLTKKFEMKHWKNSRTEGCLMNLELMDTHGTQI